MGVNFMDYIIADKTLIPTGSQSGYSEKIVYLPNSYQVNDAKRVISSRAFTREELGLPASGFVFACFNNTYKITPAVFAAWMRILMRVGGIARPDVSGRVLCLPGGSQSSQCDSLAGTDSRFARGL